MKIRQNIPNAITLGNLALGFTAILLNDPLISPLLISLAAVFDLLDGLLARVLNAKSELGSQLDSFSDLVSFGVAPAFLFYHHILPSEWYSILSIAFLPVFGALRLAVFNTSEGQEHSFKGLPIPGAGLLVAFLVYTFWARELSEVEMIFALFIPIATGLLMLSRFRMISFKNYSSKAKTEQYLIILLAISGLILVICLELKAVPLIVVIYIVLSFMYVFIKPERAA